MDDTTRTDGCGHHRDTSAFPFLTLLVVGVAVASGDFDQYGGRSSHQGYTANGIPSSSPSTAQTSALGWMSTDVGMNAAIGPDRDLWIIGDISGMKLYRYSFSIVSGNGSFTQEWSASLNSSTGGTPISNSVAVDANSNSYVVSGSDGGIRAKS